MKKKRVQLKTLLSALLSMVANTQDGRNKQPPPPSVSRPKAAPPRTAPSPRPKSKTPRQTGSEDTKKNSSWATVVSRQLKPAKPWGKAQLRDEDWDLKVKDGCEVINNPAVASAVFLLPTDQIPQLQRRSNTGRLTAITTEDPGKGTLIQVPLLLDGKTVVRKAYATTISGSIAKLLVRSGGDPVSNGVVQLNYHSGHGETEALSTSDLSAAALKIYNDFAKNHSFSPIDRHQIWASKVRTPKVSSVNLRIPTDAVHRLQAHVPAEHKGFFISASRHIQEDLPKTVVIRLDTADLNTARKAADYCDAAVILLRGTKKLGLVTYPGRELDTRKTLGQLAMPPPTPGTRYFITGPSLHRISTTDLIKILGGQGWIVDTATHHRKKGSRGFFVVKSLEEPTFSTVHCKGHGLLTINRESKREPPPRNEAEYPSLPTSTIDDSSPDDSAPSPDNSTPTDTTSPSDSAKDTRIGELLKQQRQMQVQNGHLTDKVTGLTEQASDLMARQDQQQKDQSARTQASLEDRDARIQDLLKQQVKMQEQNSRLTDEVANLSRRISELLARLNQMHEQKLSIEHTVLQQSSSPEGSPLAESTEVPPQNMKPPVHGKPAQPPTAEVTTAPVTKAPPKKASNKTMLNRIRSKSVLGQESEVAKQLQDSFSPYGDRTNTPSRSRGRTPHRSSMSKQ